MSKYFTTVLKVPDDWTPGPEITGNQYFTAGSWSHVMWERDGLRGKVEFLELELAMLRAQIKELEGETE